MTIGFNRNVNFLPECGLMIPAWSSKLLDLMAVFVSFSLFVFLNLQWTLQHEFWPNQAYHTLPHKE